MMPRLMFKKIIFIHGWRDIKSILFYLFCFMCVGVVLMFLGSIIWAIIMQGGINLSWKLFTHLVPADPSQLEAGLQNAIVGSLLMAFYALCISVVLGVSIATFLTEFRGQVRLVKWVRFCNNVLLGSPSILVGVFVYLLIVIPTRHFSGMAGAIALSILGIPIVVRGVEDVLYLVPNTLRESAVALGVSRIRILFLIIYKVVVPGIITASLLALARMLGETAPLLFTAGNNFFTTVNANETMASLPVAIYNLALSPYPSFHTLAWQGIFITVTFIFLLSIIIRFITKKHQKTHHER